MKHFPNLFTMQNFLTPDVLIRDTRCFLLRALQPHRTWLGKLWTTTLGPTQARHKTGKMKVSRQMGVIFVEDLELYIKIFDLYYVGKEEIFC